MWNCKVNFREDGLRANETQLVIINRMAALPYDDLLKIQ
jgi:hypothetical protein